MTAKAESSETLKINLKRWGAIVALGATLVAGLGSAGGWYSARVQADLQAEVQKASVEARLDKLEHIAMRQERSITLSTIQSGRTEGMIETIMTSRGLAIPPKSATQVAMEDKLLRDSLE